MGSRVHVSINSSDPINVHTAQISTQFAIIATPNPTTVQQSARCSINLPQSPYNSSNVGAGEGHPARVTGWHVPLRTGKNRPSDFPTIEQNKPTRQTTNSTQPSRTAHRTRHHYPNAKPNCSLADGWHRSHGGFQPGALCDQRADAVTPLAARSLLLGLKTISNDN